MRVVAIIPARGGSAGIVRKNLMKIDKTSLIANSIMTARKAGIKEIYVSSDCEDIREEAFLYGAKSLAQPAYVSTSKSSSESALLWAVNKLEKKGDPIDTLVFLQCTGPLLNHEELTNMIDKFHNSDEIPDCMLTVTHNHTFLWEFEEDSFIGINHNELDKRQRRQDIKPQYKETGEAYIMNAQMFKVCKSRFFGKILPFIVDRASWEIDTHSDLMITRALYEERE